MLTCLVFANVCFIEGCVNCLQSTTVGNYKKEHIKKSVACKNQFLQLECVQMQNLYYCNQYYFVVKIDFFT